MFIAKGNTNAFLNSAELQRKTYYISILTNLENMKNYIIQNQCYNTISLISRLTNFDFVHHYYPS